MASTSISGRAGGVTGTTISTPSGTTTYSSNGTVTSSKPATTSSSSGSSGSSGSYSGSSPVVYGPPSPSSIWAAGSTGASSPTGYANPNGTPAYASVVNGQQVYTPASQYQQNYQIPQLNIPSFTPPAQNTMSYDQAVSQVSGQVDPLYQQALQNINQQKYNNLQSADQLAAAKGLAHSGLAADLQNKVNLQAQQDVTNANTDKTAKIAQMAQALQQNNVNNYNTAYQNALNTWMNQANMAINTYKTQNDISQWQQQFQAQQQQQAFNQKLQQALATGRFYLD